MPAAIVPRPASCDVLDDGESAAAAAGDGLSDTHILMRCTELSKLLEGAQARRRSAAGGEKNDVRAHLM